MSTLPINAEAVTERINAMRISAEQALASVESAAASNSQALARVVAAYRSIVASTGARIIRTQALVIQALAVKPGDPALKALLARTIELLTAWTAHANGYTAYERPATEAEKSGAVSVGWAGVVIALAAAGAVIAVAFTGVAWAVVHYREAQTLSDEVALVEKDPSIADQLAKVNQTAPNSPTPDPTNPNPGSSGGWVWLLAAVGLTGAAFFILPKLGK